MLLISIRLWWFIVEFQENAWNTAVAAENLNLGTITGQEGDICKCSVRFGTYLGNTEQFFQ